MQKVTRWWALRVSTSDMALGGRGLFVLFGAVPRACTVGEYGHRLNLNFGVYQTDRDMINRTPWFANWQFYWQRFVIPAWRDCPSVVAQLRDEAAAEEIRSLDRFDLVDREEVAIVLWGVATATAGRPNDQELESALCGVPRYRQPRVHPVRIIQLIDRQALLQWWREQEPSFNALYYRVLAWPIANPNQVFQRQRDAR